MSEGGRLFSFSFGKHEKERNFTKERQKKIVGLHFAQMVRIRGALRMFWILRFVLVSLFCASLFRSFLTLGNYPSLPKIQYYRSGFCYLPWESCQNIVVTVERRQWEQCFCMFGDLACYRLSWFPTSETVDRLGFSGSFCWFYLFLLFFVLFCWFVFAFHLEEEVGDSSYIVDLLSVSFLISSFLCLLCVQFLNLSSLVLTFLSI